MNARGNIHRIPEVHPHALWLWGYRETIDRCAEQLGAGARSGDEHDSLASVAKLEDWTACFVDRALGRLATIAQMVDVDVQPGELPTLVAERPGDLVELGAAAAASAVRAAIGYARATSRPAATGSVTTQFIARLRDEAERVWRYQIDTLCAHHPWLRTHASSLHVSITDPSQAQVCFLAEVLRPSAPAVRTASRAKR